MSARVLAGHRGPRTSAGHLRSWRTGVRLILALLSATALSLALNSRAEAVLPPVSVSQVKDINPGTDDGDPILATADSGNPRAVDLDGTLIFDAAGPDGREIWRSDGTSVGTFMIKEIAVGSIFSSTPQWLTLMNGEVYFGADEVGPESDALWKTDGTEAGTVKVVDLDPVPFSTSGGPSNLVNVGGTLFFLANSDQANGRELWKSDGTAAGTTMVKDIQADLVNEATNFNAVGNRLFFAFESGAGKELWTSDGTEAGTHMVEDINPGAASGLGLFDRAAGRGIHRIRRQPLLPGRRRGRV